MAGGNSSWGVFYFCSILCSPSLACMCRYEHDLSAISRTHHTPPLQNAGIFCIIMMVMSCLCCFSYVALCCNFPCHIAVKILAVIGFILLIIGLILFIAMLAFGSYLIGQFGGRATFNGTCRSMLAYLLMMYLYLVVFIGSCIGASVWAIFGSRGDDPNKKGRESAKSNLKLPPTKVLTAMVWGVCLYWWVWSGMIVSGCGQWPNDWCSGLVVSDNQVNIVHSLIAFYTLFAKE